MEYHKTCFTLRQLNVGPVNPPTTDFSINPPVKRSTSCGVAYKFDNFFQADNVVSIGGLFHDVTMGRLQIERYAL